MKNQLVKAILASCNFVFFFAFLLRQISCDSHKEQQLLPRMTQLHFCVISPILPTVVCIEIIFHIQFYLYSTKVNVFSDNQNIT